VYVLVLSHLCLGKVVRAGNDLGAIADKFDHAELFARFCLNTWFNLFL
jgi:hypothetical protein